MRLELLSYSMLIVRDGAEKMAGQHQSVSLGMPQQDTRLFLPIYIDRDPSVNRNLLQYYKTIRYGKYVIIYSLDGKFIGRIVQ